MKQLIVCALLLAPSLPQGLIKEQSWQTGTLLATAHGRYVAGMRHNDTGTGHVYSPPSGNVYGSGISSSGDTDASSGVDTPVYRASESYFIDAGPVIYVAEERMRGRWSKPARLSVHAPVKFYLDGQTVHLLDEAGKEHEAMLVKQTPKPNPGAK